jgi:hypothetical protein
VLPIWEGTTNVLALDTLRALDGARGVDLLRREAGFLLQSLRHADLVRISARVDAVLERVRDAIDVSARDPRAVEANARRIALTLGRTFALALLARHAQWSLDNERDERPLAAARRFSAAGIDLLVDMDAEDARRLARDEP